MDYGVFVEYLLIVLLSAGGLVSLYILSVYVSRKEYGPFIDDENYDDNYWEDLESYKKPRRKRDGKTRKNKRVVTSRTRVGTTRARNTK